MKAFLANVILLLVAVAATAQCKQCVQKKVFGTPRNYELKSFELEDGTVVFGIDEKYDYMLTTELTESAETETLARKIMESVKVEYSQRFADSSRIEKIRYNAADDVDTLNGLYYRVTFILRISNRIHYRFALDFTYRGELFYATAASSIPDPVLFGKHIGCCKAIELSKKDKKDPFTTVNEIDIIHMPFPLDKIDDASLVWLVESRSRPGKKKFITVRRKYIDFFTGKVLKRTSTRIPTGPPKIVEDHEIRIM